MTREPIMVALFAKLSAIPGVITSSRVLETIASVSPAEQPALFLAPRSQVAMRVRGLPTRWVIDVAVYVYTNRGNDLTVVPDTAMNTILDAIEAALEPAPGVEVQTLGGLCDQVLIEGVVETDEGALGDQAIAIVPVRIHVSK